MMAPDWRGKVSATLVSEDDGNETIQCTSKAAALALFKWASDMDDDKYSNLLKTLGIKPRTDQPTRTRGKLLECLRSLDEDEDEGGDDADVGTKEASPPLTVTPKGRKGKTATASSAASPSKRTSTPRGKVLTSSKLVGALR